MESTESFLLHYPSLQKRADPSLHKEDAQPHADIVHLVNDVARRRVMQVEESVQQLAQQVHTVRS